MTYMKDLRGNNLIFSMGCDLSETLASEMKTEIMNRLTAGTTLQIVSIDLKEEHAIDSNALRILSPLGLDLRRKNCAVQILGASRGVRKFLASMGMDTLLKPVSAAEEPSNAKAGAPRGINVEFINPFIQGTLETLKVQCSIECQPGKPILKNGTEPPTRYDIAGVIGLTSPAFNGSIAICFPEKVFLKDMSNMMGETYGEINKELEDGAGELLNIIFGFAKRVLNEKGYALEKAIPTIVRGKELEIKHLISGKTILLPFSTEAGDFTIEVGTESAA